MRDVIVREIKMPLTSRAFTILDANGDYNVYLNCDLDEKVKEKSLQHEMKHIERDDFYSSLPRYLIESRI